MTQQEAIEKVFAELNAMTTEELRKELDKHKDGEFAKSLNEIHQFLLDKQNNSL